MPGSGCSMNEDDNSLLIHREDDTDYSLSCALDWSIFFSAIHNFW